MRRLSLLSAAAALVIVAPLVSPALAGQVNAAPTHQNAASHGFAKGGSPGFHAPGFGPSGSAPTLSTALSTALSIGGVGSHGGAQLDTAPTVQAAVGAAVAIDGNASAFAADRNGAPQGNAR